MRAGVRHAGATGHKQRTIRKICDAYRAGDNDPAGGSLKVKWREFAIDFDEQVPVPLWAGKAPPIHSLG